MAALDFIAGLGGAYAAIDAGMRAAKERQQAEEDREFLKSQRGLMQQQQQRQLDEQKRADTLREELAAIKPTEQYQDPLQLRNDEEGNPLPGVTPRMLERPRARDAQLRDVAGIYRRSGDLGRALELESAAHKEMFDRSARNYAQLKANSSGLSAADFVRQAKSIFDSDPFPMEIAAVREEPDGTVSFDIRNRDNPAAGLFTYKAKSKREAVEGLESYYSPTTYQALVDAKNKAAIEAQAKLAENPYVIVPAGGIAVSRDGSRPSVDNTNGLVWTGRTNPDGSPEMVRAGRGTAGPAGASPTRDQEIDAALKFALENSPRDARTEEQVAGINRLARQFGAQNPRDSASRVVQAAILATKNPDKIRPKFDDKTGRIVSAIDFEGGNYVLEDFGGVAKPRDVKQDVMNGIANEYVATKIPDVVRSLYVAAAFDKTGEARASINANIARETRNAYIQRNGKEPTEAELAPFIKAQVDQAGHILDLIGNHFPRDPKRISELLTGSGYSLVGGDVVRAPAGQAAQQGGAAAASGAQTGAVGSAIPADAVEQGRRAEADRRRREADAAAEQRRKEEEARQKRASDEEAVRGLTVDMVRAMTPEDAARIFRNYSSIIRDTKVREALGLRMVRRPWSAGTGGASAGAADAATPAGAAGTAPSAATQAAPAQAGAPATSAAPVRPPAAGLPASGAGLGLGSAAPARPAAAATASAPAAATQPPAQQPPAQQPPAGPTTPPAQWPRTTTRDGSVVRSPPQRIEIPSVVAMRDAVKSAAAGDTRAIGAALSAVERARADLESYSQEALRFTLLPADDTRVRAELSKMRNEIGQAGNDLAGLAAAASTAAPAAQGPAPARAPAGAAQGGAASPRPAARLPEAERQRIQSRIKDLESALLDGNRRLEAERKKARPDQRQIDLLKAELPDLQSELTELRKRLAP